MSDEVWAITLDEATLAYAKIRWEYHTVDESGAPSGVVKGGWDLKVNKTNLRDTCFGRAGRGRARQDAGKSIVC